MIRGESMTDQNIDEAVRHGLHAFADGVAFHFNYVSLSPWTSAWGIFAPADVVTEARSAFPFDAALSIDDMSQLTSTLTNVGTVESAAPIQFGAIVTEFLLAMLMKSDYVISRIQRWPRHPDLPAPEEIWRIVRDGMLTMLKCTVRDKCAFWTNGTAKHREIMLERVRRSMLPREHGEYLCAPHVQREFRDLMGRVNFQHRELRKLVGSQKGDSMLKREIYEVTEAWDQITVIP